jgi:DNA-binding transcriptional MerR regulator
MSQKHDAVYIISVAAELVGMHPQTLRVYERRGLVDPFRTPGGTRRYSQDDLNRLLLIQQLSNDGINLEGIKRILVLRRDNARLSDQVRRLRRLLENSESRWNMKGGASVRLSTRRSQLSVRRDDSTN